MMHNNNNNVFVDEVTTKPVLIYILSFNPLGYKMVGLANCLPSNHRYLSQHLRVYVTFADWVQVHLSSCKTNEVIRVQQKPRINQSSVKRIWLIARQ